MDKQIIVTRGRFGWGRYARVEGELVPVISGGIEPVTTAALIAGGGALVGGLLGRGGSSSEKTLNRLLKSPFEHARIQQFLPPSLRLGETGPLLGAGIQGIGELLRRPGGLSPSVSEAILPRVAAESETLAQTFRGIRSQQAGRAARANVPLSIRSAVQSAIDIAQSRQQRGIRREALTESEQLRRQDLSQTFRILDAILQFQSARLGQAVPGLAQTAGFEQRREASNLAFAGSLLGSPAFQQQQVPGQTRVPIAGVAERI